MAYKKHRSDMTEEERLDARRKAKASAYRAAMGQAYTTTAEETEQANTRVRRLRYRHGMSTRQMCAQTGLSESTIKDCLKGYRQPGRPLTFVSRDTFNAIMAIEVEMPDGRALVPAVGARRRLRALTREGFPLRILAEYTEYGNIWRIIHRSGRGLIYWETHQKIIDVYDKLIRTEPDVEARYLARNRNEARRKGFEPYWCWDEDTIDDPDAIPEWTGACGTEEGYWVHVRETVINNNPLPLCLPCREAVETVEHSEFVAFRRERYNELLEDRGINPRQLAARMYPGLSNGAVRSKSDALYRWASGDRRPRSMGQVQGVALALDAPLEDLVDMSASREATQGVVAPGKFNHFFFRAAIDLSGMSQRQFADLPKMKVSQATIGKWMRGAYAPSDRKLLKPIADHFRVGVDVFYQPEES